VDDVGSVTKYSKEWEPSPRLTALLASQAVQQQNFDRVGANKRVKVRFRAPATTIWGKPLPACRYKNLKHKWYRQNVEALLPPLPAPEYDEVYNLVTGTTEMPPLIPRRPSAFRSQEQEEREGAEKQSSLLLEGPQPGLRAKTFDRGRPHHIKPRLLRHILLRAVLKKAPVAKVAEPGKSKRDIVFRWDDGQSRARAQMDKLTSPTSESQFKLLFG
jgi:hypothetical protein